MLNSEPDPIDALKLNKTAKANNDGTYTVTLEAYTTGKVTSTTTNIPTDIVLVLDQSGSMARCMEHGQTVEHGLGTYSQFDGPYSIDGTYYLKNNDTKYTQIYYCDGTSIDHKTSGNKHVEGWYSSTNHNKGQYLNTQPTEIYIQDSCTSESRLAALKTAANGFAVEVAAKASANDVNHRIAVVGFAGAASSSYTNTGLFDGSSFTKYDSITDDQYKAALKNMNTSEGVGSVTASINNLAASGATSIDLGVIMANNIFENNTVVGERNRVVIVFTDGVPTTQTAFDMGVANSAITAAGITKNTHKATVYAIGVFGGADPTSAGNSSGGETEKANWFMQNLSSNNGNVSSPSFYLSASNAGALNSIFQAISSNITSPDIELGASTQIRDTISPYFKLQAGKLKAYTVDSTGGENFSSTRKDANVTLSNDEKEITLTGFDFDANFVSTTAKPNTTDDYGRKLILEFVVEREAGFIGGNGVPTNAGAGVYEKPTDTSPIKPFPDPKVNVEIKDITVTVTPQDKCVYLMDTVTQEQLLEGATAAVGAEDEDPISLKLDEENYGLDEWQYAYANISTALTLTNGSSIPEGDLTNLKEDKEYNIKVTVSPNSADDANNDNDGEAAVEKTGSKNLKVYVLMPTVVCKNNTLFLGDTKIPWNTSGSTGYLNGFTKSWSAQPANSSLVGSAPELTLEIDETALIAGSGADTTGFDPIKVGIHPLKIKVKIGVNDVTQWCSITNVVPDTVTKDCHFTITVVAGTLTITKSGGADGENYIFTITNDKGLTLFEVIQGNNNKTITGLPKGTYTVIESTSWSWRYNNTAYSWGTVGSEISAAKPDIACTVTNSNRTPFWLSGESSAVNKFQPYVQTAQ